MSMDITGIQHENINDRASLTNDYNGCRIFGRIFSLLTAGIINISSSGVVVKDPITGLKDIGAEIYDRVVHQKMEGVWLGRRGIYKNCFGVDGGICRCGNVAIMHQAVRVNGKAYHLAPTGRSKTNIKMSGGTYTIAELTQPWYFYEWVYKGKVCPEHSIEAFIDMFESLGESFYDSLQENCQDVAEALFKYARGTYDVKTTFYFIKQNKGKKLCERFCTGFVDFITP